MGLPVARAEQLIDYIRAASTHFGGITPLRKVMDYAAQYQIKSGFHGPTDVSPVGLAAELHVGLAIHNFGIQEYMQHSDKTNTVFEQSMTFEDGYLHPGDRPGLGVELNEEAAAALSVPAGISALQPTRGRHRARLVRRSAISACNQLVPAVMSW